MLSRFTRPILAALLVLAAIPSMAGAFANNDSLKAQLVRDWERAKAYTKEYLDAMPEDGVNYKPAEGIRSFAEQMLHLSQGNVGLSSNGTGRERIYAGKNLEKMDEFRNKAALTKVVMECYDFVIDGIRNMDASKLDEKVKRGNFDETRLAWLSKAFEHQTHHRGQTTIYLRMKGVTPPNEKLF
ncbi:MAG TPA: DinB family protein [Chitinophagaceae bacterium]|nr:DinB family protein [Chitinophagaceae bacterium]